MKIEPFQYGDINNLKRLAEVASKEGFHFINQLVHQWESGQNRFDKRGECLIVIKRDRAILAVCGLNQDPYIQNRVQNDSIGRLRRLYVHPAYRQKGLASALFSAILKKARQDFSIIRLSTDNRSASSFYLSQGFKLSNDLNETHRFVL